MKLTKQDIQKALKEVTLPGEGVNIIEAGAIKNIQIFGKEIELDIEVANPTLQYKQSVKNSCIKILHDVIANDLSVKVNLTVNTPPVNTVIKGSPIPGVKNIIAVSSAKGGVGKSTIAANLAIGLSNSGFKVGVIDADIYGPSMHIMFGLSGEKPQAIEVEGKSKIKPLENYNIKLLSIGFFAETQQAMVWRGPMASKALNQLLWDAYWGDLDYLVVDLPPGTGDIHLSLVQSIPLTGAIIISTPQEVALADAKKGIEMFRMKSIDVPVLGIIENMSYFTPKELPENKYYIFGKEGVKGLSEDMDIPLLAEIPIVQSIREAADAGRPAILQETTPVALEMLNMTKNVISAIEERNVNLKPTESVKITHTRGCST